jgi:hypothetical protein
VALISLPACGRAPTPIEPTTKASTPSSGPSTEATSTLKPPALPAAAKRNDETGAANFVLYWVNLSNYASHTGDTERLSAITDEACTGCQRYIQLYEKTYARGGYFKGSDWKLSKISVERGTDESLVRAHVSAPVGQFREDSGSPTKNGNDEDADLAFGVQWRGGSWRLTQLGLQDEVVP